MRERQSLHRVTGIVAAIATALLANTAGAAPWVMAGARYQAMGGAGVAVANDSLASYWNPANLAFEKGYDLQLPFTLDANIENDALEDLGDLLFAADNVRDALDKARLGTGPLTQTDAQEVTDVLLRFAGLGRNGQSVHFGAGLGLLGHSKSLGVHALSISQGTVFPEVDTENLSLFSGSGTAVSDFLANTNPTSPVNDSALQNQIAGLGSPWNATDAGKFVWLAEQGGFDTHDPAVRAVMLGIATQTGDGSGTKSLQNNTTGALVAGISTQEFGVSYGLKLPIPFLDVLRERVSVGVTLKYMLGVTFVEFVEYNSGRSAGGVAGGTLDFSNRKTSHNFGLDLGASVRPFDWLRLGMTARNVNSPSFDANRIGEITLEPQVRLGAGLYPIDHLVLALDLDATENQFTTVPGFRSRLLSMGAEYTVPLGSSVALALRFGAYENTASGMNADWALTGGLGLRLWSFVIDASGGGSLANERVRTSGNEFVRLPTRFNAGLTLKWEKSL